MRRPFRSAALAALLWTVFGALSALQVYVRDLSGRPGASLKQVGNIVWFYWAWALVTPLLVRIARSFADSDTPWARRIVWHLPAAVGISALQSALYQIVCAVWDRTPLAAVPAAAVDTFIRHGAGDVLLVATIVGIYTGFRYYTDTQRRLLHAREVESSLKTAQLEALKAQLQPHFLFNTLHAIGVLVREDPSAATRMVALLGDLLRMTLARAGDQEVRLEQELELVRLYLEIERTRFQDRLAVEIDVAADVQHALVPDMLLQPIVENAVRHGIAARPDAGRITVRASRDGDTLRVVVADDGPGLGGSPSAAGHGVGIAATRARLSLLYGDAQSLDVRDADGGGCEVTITLPYRADTATPTAPGVRREAEVVA